MAKPPTEENKQIARTARDVFAGQEWKVINYLDRDEKSNIDILHSTETPGPGLTSYCTIGLSDYVNDLYRVDPPLGVEIIGVGNAPEFGEIVSTAAMCVINSGYQAKPGGAFPGVVKMYYPRTTVPDLFFVEPYLWDEQAFSSRVFGNKTVAWVQALPISDAETQYILDHGADELQRLLEKHDPDFTDLERDSVV